MIKNIKKQIQNNFLTVEVECTIRKFASHPIKLLTTEKLIDTIGKEYNVIKTIGLPKHKVGNTNRHKIKNTGTWIFEIDKQDEEPTKEKPKKTRTRSTTTKKKSIRSRMSSLNKSDS
tara:strand:+ start:100 stop:450 length:351 start_codon:yes stop_codon:yes gene_type:complete